MERAYSILEVKSLDTEKRIFRGIASTPDLDRVGDIMVPHGAEFAAEIPLLWQHDKSKPIGVVRLSPPTEKGIEFEAEIFDIPDAGTLKDRLDEAWHSVKNKVVRAVSIGFAAKDYLRLPEGGRKFLKYAIHELSVVTIPCNQHATIHLAKSLDEEILKAASGTDEETNNNLAGVSAKNNKKNTKEFNLMKTFAEMRAEAEALRTEKADRLDELLVKSYDNNASLASDEDKEYRTLEDEIKALDIQIERLKARETDNVSKATRIEGIKSFEDASNVRNRQSVTVKGNNVPKGVPFTHLAMTLMKAKGNLMQAHEISKSLTDTPEVEIVLKAAVAAGTTKDPEWARPLVEYQTMSNEFVELLRPETVVGKLEGFKRVPFNIRIPGQTSGSTVNWVGESQPKPVSRLGFADQRLDFHKLAGIVTFTDELIKFSNPQVTGIVQADLIATIASFLDVAFLDPTKAAETNVSPASITNGVTPIVASGTTADHLKADVQRVFKGFLAAGQSVAGSYWIMSATQALAISMLQNAVGNAEFPGLTMNGGTFFGLPVVVSEAEVTQGRLVLVKTSEILLAEEGIVLDSTDQASLIMDSDPSRAGAPVAESLWQHNRVAIRAERFITWSKRRPNAVAVISEADYGALGE